MDMHTLPMRMERALAPQRQAALGGQTRALHSGSYGAMAERWIPDPKVGGSNPSSFTHIFLFFFLPPCNKKKGGQGGFEPPTSRTQSENHTPRPLARSEPRGIRTPNLRVWNPTRCHCAIGSGTTCNNMECLKPILRISIGSNCDTLAEWLRRRPAKPLGFAREGSNPSGVVF